MVLIAFLLSFMWPGAGQVYNGEFKKGLWFSAGWLLVMGNVIWHIAGMPSTTTISWRNAVFTCLLPFLVSLWSVGDALLIADRNRSTGHPQSNPPQKAFIFIAANAFLAFLLLSGIRASIRGAPERRAKREHVFAEKRGPILEALHRSQASYEQNGMADFYAELEAGHCFKAAALVRKNHDTYTHGMTGLGRESLEERMQGDLSLCRQLADIEL